MSEYDDGYDEGRAQTRADLVGALRAAGLIEAWSPEEAEALRQEAAAARERARQAESRLTFASAEAQARTGPVIAAQEKRAFTKRGEALMRIVQVAEDRSLPVDGRLALIASVAREVLG